MAIISVPSTAIQLWIQLAGDISSFGSPQQDSFEASLRAFLNCQPPLCYLTTHLSAGSISVEAILTIPNESGPDDGRAGGGTSGNGGGATGDGRGDPIPSDTATAIQAAALRFVADSPTSLSSALGVEVESVSPNVSIQTDVLYPIVVGPPPPSPPPSLSSEGDSSTGSAGIGSTGTDAGTVVGVAAGVVAVMLGGLGGVGIARRRRRRQLAASATQGASKTKGMTMVALEINHNSAFTQPPSNEWCVSTVSSEPMPPPLALSSDEHKQPPGYV